MGQRVRPCVPNLARVTAVDRREFLSGSAAFAGAASVGLVGCRTVGPAGASAPAPSALKPSTRAGTGGSNPLDEFGLTQAQLRRVFAKAMSRGGDFCDLFFQRRVGSSLVLEDGAVNRAHSHSDLGLGVRVVRGVETGYAYTESLDLASMLHAAEVAASVASGTARATPRTFRVGRSAQYYAQDLSWEAVPTARKVALLERLQQLAAAEDARIKKISITYRDEDSHVLVADSDGRIHADHQPMTICYLNCSAEHKNRWESNYAGRAARAGREFWSDDRLAAQAKEAVARTVVLFEAVGGPLGELPVVLGPGSSGILLHEAIGHGMEADFARKRTTIYSDKLGQRIAPPFVTVVDDGTQDDMRGSINVDDEGNAAQRTTLVENGVLKTFLHDRISARHFGVTPTGSGRRQSFRHMPLPRMRNTYMLNGPHGRDEIIGSVKKGIYAEHFTNGQVKIGAGDFTFYIKNGVLIEDGKLTRPIKDVNIIGNGPKVLEAVAMVGNDFRFDEGGWTCGKRGQGVPVGLGMPTVKVGQVTIGGTAKGV